MFGAETHKERFTSTGVAKLPSLQIALSNRMVEH